ncbi:hypothetical protein Agub_g3434, partial [Astrephomene gubernaculifera]
EGEMEEVLLGAPRATWNGVTRPRFNPAGSQVVAVSCAAPRQALVFDVRTATRIAVLDPPALPTAATATIAATAGGPSAIGARTTLALSGFGGGIGGVGGGGMGGGAPNDPRRPGGRAHASLFSAAACYSPTGEMLLWGNCLYDLRSVTAVHQFDQFTDIGSGTFHPAGLEVILNSEVWDLRSLRLLRSVPSLDGASLAFNGAGDVLYAARRQADEPFSQLFHPRRARHPLHAAFRTLDAASYGDIATVGVERVVLDLAVEPTDSLVAVVALDAADEELSSAARVYEVGRMRPAEEDSDAEEEEDEDEEESEGGSEDEEDMEFDEGVFDTPAPAAAAAAAGRRRQQGRPDNRGQAAGAAAGGGGGAGPAARRLVAEIFGGEGGNEEDGEGEGELAGAEGEDDDDDADADDADDGSDDEEMGMAMLEDAYAALEDAYGGGEDEEEDLMMDGEDDFDDE